MICKGQVDHYKCQNLTDSIFCNACFKYKCSQCDNLAVNFGLCNDCAKFHQCFNHLNDTNMRCTNFCAYLFCYSCSANVGYSLGCCLEYSYTRSIQTFKLLLNTQKLDQDYLNILLKSPGYRQILFDHPNFFINVTNCYKILKKEIDVNLTNFLIKKFLIAEVSKNLVSDLKIETFPNTATYQDLYQVHYHKPTYFMSGIEHDYKKLKFANPIKLLDFMSRSGYKLFYENDYFKNKYIKTLGKFLVKNRHLVVDEEHKFFIYCLIGRRI